MKTNKLVIAFATLASFFSCQTAQQTSENEKLYYPENFNTYEGIEIYTPSQWNSDRYLRLKAEATEGYVGRYYFGDPAIYTVSLTGISDGYGSLNIQLLINGENAGSVKFTSSSNDAKSDTLVKTIKNLDMPKYSALSLRFSGTNGQAWLIDNVKLIETGSYIGSRDTLPKPENLLVYNSLEEQSAGHAMLEKFVQKNVDRQSARRDSILSGLRAPEEWRAYQQTVRNNLASIFGPFPEKTPLNPHVLERLDYPDYYIEKIIYESQPGYFIPANLYVPKNREFPVPGILFTIGHSDDGKGEKLYYETGIGLAKKGYVALLADPVGQGERSEYFDPETREPLVGMSVDQHHYISRPAFLVDWSLSGLRTWDCIRAIDYLVSRPEVDTSRIGVTGNSGGGQMAMLTAAVDKRIKAVAAAHPGGSMEGTYLTGQTIPNHDVFCLIPPRPCRIIVGDASGEEANHRKKLDDMVRFYKGLGIEEEKWDLDIVNGVHDMKQPKRESAYEWLNRWLDKPEEGNDEPSLQTEEIKALWCTDNGVILAALNGESAQTLNQKRGDRIYHPLKDRDELKERILKRLHLDVPEPEAPQVRLREIFTTDDIVVEKFVYDSERGIEIPSLLLRPEKQMEKNKVILYVSDKGKPTGFDGPSIPLNLVRSGYPVLSIDVRGVGETATYPPVGELDKYTGYTSRKWIKDMAAIQAASFHRTMLGMQILDVLKGIDLLSETDDLKNKSIILVGEGLGGLWALAGNIFRSEAAGAITINTLPSYRLLLSGKYYNQRGYFWVPGALKDYDIPNLSKLTAPNNQLWIDPTNALSEKMKSNEITQLLGNPRGFQIVITDLGSTTEISEEIVNFLNSN